MADSLQTVLADGVVRLEPLVEHHIAPLRAACAKDQEIWQIYPFSMLEEHFEQAMERFHQTDNCFRFAVLHIAGDMKNVVGMTSFINPDMANGVVEIGGTYVEPAVRGSGFNDVMKRLMIDHAFASGYRRIEFRVDARNARSRAAVLKLGAVHEGTLRKNRITWTGYVRDTCVFGLLEDEWRGRADNG